MFAGAADHRAAAVGAADDEPAFENRGKHDDAFGLVDQVRGDVIRHVHDFLQHRAAVLQAALFLGVREHARKRPRGESKNHNDE